jgi:hypothetical protein
MIAELDDNLDILSIDKKNGEATATKAVVNNTNGNHFKKPFLKFSADETFERTLDIYPPEVPVV